MINYKKKALILQCGKCKDVIQSQYRRHFIACQCGDIFTDGGEDYMKCSTNEDTIVLKNFGVTWEVEDEYC